MLYIYHQSSTFNVQYFYYLKVNQQQNNMIANWEQFTQKFALDPHYGILIPPEYIVSSFNFETLLNENLRLQNLEKQEEIAEFIQNFPNLHLTQPLKFADLIILHDFTITIINTYLRKKESFLVPEQTIKIPKNLSQPVYISTKRLGMAYGMSVNAFFNWVPLNDNYLKEDESFGLADIALRYYLTSQKYQELLFFGGAVIGSFYLARVLKKLVQINEIIQNRPNLSDEVIEKLAECLKYWHKIQVQNKIVAQHFQPDYFNNVLRPQLRGFKDLILEDVQNGKDIVASAHGGSAGYDPSFQMFEAAFGLKSEGAYHNMQVHLRDGMPSKHVECIQYLQEKSLVREYCSNGNQQVKNMYNNVVRAYGKFLRVHSQFVINFIPNPSKKKSSLNEHDQSQKGTAGILIKSMVLRYENVESQVIK